MRTLCHYTSSLLEGKKKESLNACADWTAPAHEDMFSKAFPKMLNLIWHFDILLVCLHCSVTQDQFGPIPNALSSVGPPSHFGGMPAHRLLGSLWDLSFKTKPQISSWISI